MFGNARKRRLHARESYTMSKFTLILRINCEDVALAVGDDSYRLLKCIQPDDPGSALPAEDMALREYMAAYLCRNIANIYRVTTGIDIIIKLGSIRRCKKRESVEWFSPVGIHCLYFS